MTREQWISKFEEEDDIAELAFDAISDDAARALDYFGWMIVSKSDGPGKWPIDSETGYVPEWAKDIAPPTPVVRPVVRLVPRDKQSFHNDVIDLYWALKAEEERGDAR